jgi:hypothetical protein
MALLPTTGFPATAYPVLPAHRDNALRQFDPDTLPIGRAGGRGFGGRSAVDPTTASHM